MSTKPQIAQLSVAPRTAVLARMMATVSLYAVMAGVFLVYIAHTYANIIHAALTMALWDFKLFYGGDRDFFAGGSLYRPSAALGFARLGTGVSPNNNSPVGALIFLPFSRLSLSTAALLWEAGSLLLCVAAAYIWTSLGGPTRWRSRLGLLLLIYLSYPVQDALWLGTWGPIVAFCDIGAWYFARRGDDRRAGILLGLALAVRWQPCILLLFIIMQRRWRVAAFSLLPAVVSGALALAVFGLHSFAEFAGMILHAGGAVGSAYDGSLPAALVRLAGAVWQHSPGLASIVSHIGLCGGALLAGLTLWRCRSLGFDEGFSLCIVCGLLITPLSWMHYDMALLLPLAVIARRRLWPAVITSVFWLMVTLLSPDFTANPVLFGSVLTASILLLYAVLYRDRFPRQPAAAQAAMATPWPTWAVAMPTVLDVPEESRAQ